MQTFLNHIYNHMGCQSFSLPCKSYHQWTDGYCCLTYLSVVPNFDTHWGASECRISLSELLSVLWWTPLAHSLIYIFCGGMGLVVIVLSSLLSCVGSVSSLSPEICARRLYDCAASAECECRGQGQLEIEWPDHACSMSQQTVMVKYHKQSFSNQIPPFLFLEQQNLGICKIILCDLCSLDSSRRVQGKK
jgi:hypothetical protein